MSHLTRPGFARGLRGSFIVVGACLLTSAQPAMAEPPPPTKLAYGGGFDYDAFPTSTPKLPSKRSDIGSLLGAQRYNVHVNGPNGRIQATLEVPTGPFSHPTPLPVRVWATSSKPQPDLEAKLCVSADCFDVLATVKVPVTHIRDGIQPQEVVVFSGPGSVFLQVDSHSSGNGSYRGGYVGRSGPMWSVALAGTVDQDLPDVAFGESTAEHGRRTGLRAVRAGNRLNDYPFLVHGFDAIVMGPNAEVSEALAAELAAFAAAGGIVVSDRSSVPSSVSTLFIPVEHGGRDMVTHSTNLVTTIGVGALPFLAAEHGDGHWLARTGYATGHELAAALLETEAKFSVSQPTYSYLSSRPESDTAKVATYRRNGGAVSTMLALLWVVFALVLFGLVRRRGWRTAISVLAGASFVSTIGFLAVASVWRTSSEPVKVTTLEREYGASTVMEWGASAQRTGVLSSKAKLWVPDGQAYARTLVHRSGDIKSVKRTGDHVKVRTSGDEVVIAHWRRVLPEAESLDVQWSNDRSELSFSNTTSHALRFAAMRTSNEMRYAVDVPSSMRRNWHDMVIGTYSLDAKVRRSASDIAALRFLRELSDDCGSNRLSHNTGADVCAVGIAVLPNGELIGYRTQGAVTTTTKAAEAARIANKTAAVTK